ncbi:hypothetical protein CCH79_00005855 [Gambusia affinis]|uniref:Uncharacterized protein n=1 Tax=Gambusia affinis TaxID=33528 RepID=A0A315VKS8_GAMAF|nr:hypothetical protein CCH79_00005855 [Gambusia affinis]
MYLYFNTAESNDEVISRTLENRTAYVFHLVGVSLVPQAKESELEVICALLEDPTLCSQTFREWKQWHSELYAEICQLSPGTNGQDDLSPMGAPLMTHTHSFIETHV